MMKPGIGAYERFKQLFEAASRAAGKEQYLIPYFIAAHPGTSDEGYVQSGPLAQTQQLPPGSGADLPTNANGIGYNDVPHAQEPVTGLEGRGRERRGHS